jgi:hypothetical protein
MELKLGAPPPGDGRDVSWRGYRVRVATFWSAAIGWLPACVVVLSLFGVQGLTLAFALVWFAGIAALGIWQSAWLCPRCRHPFLGLGWGYSRTCATCGLRVGERP